MIEELNLPEWAFLDANSHLGDQLKDRTVILHVRSATIIEIFDRSFEQFNLKEDVITFKFKNVNNGIEERLLAAVHYSAVLDVKTDREFIINNIVKSCAMWYCEYCDWEDNNL